MEKSEFVQKLEVLPEIKFLPQEKIKERKVSFGLKLKIKILTFFKFFTQLISNNGWLTAIGACIILLVLATFPAVFTLWLIGSLSLDTSLKVWVFSGVSLGYFLLGLIIIFLAALTRKEIEKEIYKKSGICLTCQSKKVKKDFPYCSLCFKRAIEETGLLKQEAEQKIKKALDFGLEGQAKGAVKYFLENLPEPIKFIIEKNKEIEAGQILIELQKILPEARVFKPEGFVKYRLDSAAPEANIPVEGFETLERLKILFENKQLKKGGEQNVLPNNS